jgi:hypothetical protein
LTDHLGVNYDTCHLAVEFEEPLNALECLRQHGIRVSKLHLSSALKLRPSAGARKALESFVDEVYLHQVVVRHADGQRVLYRDLPNALAQEPLIEDPATLAGEEWRVHFHVPLHSAPASDFETTADHLLGALDWLQCDPARCSHLEMETYTWEVLPEELRSRDVVDQLAAEYEWTLNRLRERGLA